MSHIRTDLKEFYKTVQLKSSILFSPVRICICQVPCKISACPVTVEGLPRAVRPHEGSCMKCNFHLHTGADPPLYASLFARLAGCAVRTSRRPAGWRSARRGSLAERKTLRRPGIAWEVLFLC